MGEDAIAAWYVIFRVAVTGGDGRRLRLVSMKVSGVTVSLLRADCCLKMDRHTKAISKMALPRLAISLYWMTSTEWE